MINLKCLKNSAKWVWMAAILAFIIFYIISKKELIAETVSMLPLEALLASTALIIAAKLCLVVNMRLAANRFNITLGWKECYCIYNMTQLAKYVPGSIWHFIGRITILRQRGVATQPIRDSLLAEHLWVITSAILLSFLLVFTSIQDFFQAELSYNLSSTLLQLVLVFTCGATVLSLLFIRRLSRWLLRLLPPLTALPFLLFIWIFLGASMWVTLQPFVLSMPPILYIIGVYCFAYVAGFLVPFAPAGLGIREVILTFTLTPFMGTDVAILLAAVNRIIYFTVEILLAALCLHQNTWKLVR